MTGHAQPLGIKQAAPVLSAIVLALPGAYGVEAANGNPVTDLVAALAGQDASLRPGCRAALERHTAAAWCGRAARLRSAGRKLRHVTGTRAVRLAGDPLQVGQRVRVRAARSSHRAHLALVVRDGDSVTYARFTVMGGRRLVATASSRRTAAGLALGLATRNRRWRPVVQRTASLAPGPAPPRPPRPPQPSPPSRLVTRECGPVAPATALDVDAFNELWGIARSGPGWTGGDVTFSTALPLGRTAWIFGDTFIDHVTAGGRRTGGLVHNSIVVQDGPCLTTYANGTSAAPDALLRPTDPTRWYWPADATVEGGDHLHVLAWLMRSTGAGVWDFEIVRTDLVSLALPDLAEESIQRLPAAPGVAWGSAVTVDGGRTYVYGIHVHEDRTPYLHVARTTSDLEGPWEYRTADDWSPDPDASEDQLPGISHQISVLPAGDQYFLITQDPALGADISLYRAATPAGPWELEAASLARAEPPLPGTFTYNAVAHPELTAGGRLLVSYNVNSVDPEDALIDPAVYHPRFLTVPWPPVPAEPVDP